MNTCTIGFAANCENQQTEIKGRCCELCPPGEYVKDYCSQDHSTVCSPCEEGHYSAQYDAWQNCEECHTCQHEYVRKCTSTTNAECSCRPGFLCSNHVCSQCEKKTCKKGEELKRTGLKDYSYKCEPCPDNTYSDSNEGHCKPFTQCSANGFTSFFPGNKTHNSVCHLPRIQTDGHSTQVILAVGFLFISFAFLVLLFYACVRSLRKLKAKNRHAANVCVVSQQTSDFHLSKEESGIQLILQDEPKEGTRVSQLALEQLTTV
ncbi:tumor necrosis factor receptor superfamily member 18 [Centroberyx gerrardi]